MQTFIKSEAELLFTEAEAAQKAYWDALSNLEKAMGDIEIDGTQDLGETSVESLLSENDRCSECAAELTDDDGEGFDGRCGSCADVHEAR